MRCGVLTVAALVAGGFVSEAPAADAFYLGAWKIVSAATAPWADPKWKPDPSEMRSLLGQTISIRAKAIVGPKILACRGPNYRVRDYSADWLFQGAFGEMHARDKSADPAKLAAAFGFHGSSWKTLETGCANELDFHFIDMSTAAFGLNDYIYTLKKQVSGDSR